MRTSLPLCFILAACTSSSSGPTSSDPSGGKADGTASTAPDHQSAAELANHASTVKWLLAKSSAHAIVCKAKSGSTITIKPGTNADDNTGLVVQADYSYGTDAIQELHARTNLLVEWGEEGNYVLTIPSYAWLLFGYDGSSAPQAASDADAVGTVVSEQETVEQVACNAQ